MDSGLEKRHIPDRPGPDALKGKENSNKLSLTKAFFSGQLNEILGLGSPLKKKKKKVGKGQNNQLSETKGEPKGKG